MSHALRRELESLPRTELRNLQLQKLNQLLGTILPDNQFYQDRLGRNTVAKSLQDLKSWPLLTKSHLLPAPESTSQHARHLTHSPECYVRFHRTSGTQGNPLVIMDTREDWAWWVETWQYVLDTADVSSDDRAVMAFSFGPFIGFWSANDALVARGALVIPGGGLSTLARLQLIQDEHATIVCCTPSYALHLAAVAKEQGTNLRSSAVRKIIVAGEPGGSLPSIRDRISQAWDAEVIDHAGATEVGPWGFADSGRAGLHIVESEFIAEYLPVSGVEQAGEPAPDSALDWEQVADTNRTYELVLTNLGRFGAPLLRYRTGDLVRVTTKPDSCPNRFAFLEGGVLGRVDNMMIVRGVNVYPSAIEQILREFDEIEEYRLTVSKRGEMDALKIDVETTTPDLIKSVTDALRVRLGLHVNVEHVEAGSLPRFELKGRRFVDQR